MRRDHSLNFYRLQSPWTIIAILVISLANSASADTSPSESEIESAIRTIRTVRPEGEGFAAVGSAARQLETLPSSDIFVILDAMRDADPVAQNWLRGIAANIVLRSGTPDVSAIQDYIKDRQNSPQGRAAAMVMLKEQSLSAYESILDQSQDDPSLLIREMAVDRQITKAEELVSDQPESAKASLRKTLQSARHPIQLASVLKKLNQLGDPVTTSQAFAMIESWTVIGPFDNVDGVGFAAAYPPELNFESDGKIKSDSTYDGKDGPVTWKAIQAVDDGRVDLAAAFDKEKGAVAYAYTEFSSDTEQEAQLRIGTMCANEAWINGKPVLANEVYHAGNMIDQYVATIQLKKGTNRILLKICQNEQTDSWAQEWEFQCRVTDPTGKGLVGK